MNNILLPQKVNPKYLFYLSWLIVLTTVCISFIRFPLASAFIGDESYYKGEVDYLSGYGLYNALSQGTSVLYSSLIYLLAKLCGFDFLTSARVLSVIFFLVSCAFFSKCFSRFKGIGDAEKYFGVIFFATISASWLWKGLPDMVGVSFILAGFYIVLSKQKYSYMLLAGILIFMGFAVKPTTVFTIPGFMILIFFSALSKGTLKRNAIKTALFLLGFCTCFIIYHIPGYQANHRLMLEDKNHAYVDGKRVENHTSWNERNVYCAAYNVHHKPTEWYVTWGEIDSFKQQHPEINLNLGYTQFVSNYPAAWAKEIASKFFQQLPAHIQHGFFFSKWAVVNKVVNNFFIIGLITLLLISAMCLSEIVFIKQNLLLYAVPFLFFMSISLYLYIALQNNWLLFCLPFFALPVIKLLCRHCNVVILFLLQFIYIIYTK